jgi:hypothetical protein
VEALLLFSGLRQIETGTRLTMINVPLPIVVPRHAEFELSFEMLTKFGYGTTK